MARSSGAHDATALAVLHAVLGGAAGWLIVAREPRLAGAAVVLASLAGAGAVGFAERSGGARAAFAAEAAERVFDAATLAPLVWVSQSAAPTNAVLALVVLGAGAVASYQGARARSLGFAAPRWPAYRLGRALYLGTALLALRPFPGLLAMLILDAGVAAARWRLVAREPA